MIAVAASAWLQDPWLVCMKTENIVLHKAFDQVSAEGSPSAKKGKLQAIDLPSLTILIQGVTRYSRATQVHLAINQRRTNMASTRGSCRGPR